MKNTLKRFMVVILSVVICILSVSSACAVSSPDQSVLIAAEDKYEPLYTIPTENSLSSSEFSDFNADSKKYALFYTQTTFLALLAGYLIIYKIKGIDHSQKMHRRLNTEE